MEIGGAWALPMRSAAMAHLQCLAGESRLAPATGKSSHPLQTSPPGQSMASRLHPRDQQRIIETGTVPAGDPTLDRAGLGTIRR